MYLQTLKNIMSAKRLCQSDLATLAGVSRACVSKWFRGKKEWVNMESETLKKLAAGLNVPPDLFFQERKNLSSMETRFLWDHLYPNMEEFVQALIRGRPQALARLTQILGFKEAMAVAGKKIIKRFDAYKQYIKPVRRKQLEILWPLYTSET